MEGREALTMDRGTELTHPEDGMLRSISNGGVNEIRGGAGRLRRVVPCEDQTGAASRWGRIVL